MTCNSVWFYPSPVRRLLVWLLAIVFMLQSGCAALTPPATTHQTTLGRLAIISGAEQPKIDFRAFSQGKGEGAVEGAGLVFEGCIEGFTQAGGGAEIIFMLPVCIVAAVVGGVGGAVMAPSAETVKEAGADLPVITYARAIQEPLRSQVATLALAYAADLVSVSDERAYAAASAQDYSMLSAEGADTVLEVAMTHVGIGGGGINDPLVLYMEAHVRLVRTTDNLEVFSADYGYLGEMLKLEEWSANRGRRLQQALKRSYAIFGGHIHDSVFLLYPFPDRGPNFFVRSYGLKPLEPETWTNLTGTSMLGLEWEWESVDGLRPTFRWQGFPRDTDITAAPEKMGRVRNVRYDLIIAPEQNMAPGKIVYRRDGLTDSVHTIQKTLKANTRYFWTVRARFDLDGRERVTEWGSMDPTWFERLASPSSWSYRFKTPIYK